jgi:hypothetical protein
MSDDKSKRGEPDRSTINTSEEYEIQYWCKELGCTRQQLLAAVQAVGKNAAKVREYLISKK